MPKFLFQPDPVDGYEFHPIPIDIHLGIIKLSTKEVLHDDAINNTESITVGTDRKEVLNRLQTSFVKKFYRYGKLRESDIRPTDYAIIQAWIRIKSPYQKFSKYEG